MKTLTIRLPDLLDRQLDAAARTRQESRSVIVRKALTEWLSRDGAAGSALEAAGDLVGSLNGPPDLSTNPSHLDDFGR